MEVCGVGVGDVEWVDWAGSSNFGRVPTFGGGRARCVSSNPRTQLPGLGLVGSPGMGERGVGPSCWPVAVSDVVSVR